VRCPDGSIRTVLRDINTAFPLFIPGWSAKAQGDISGWEQVKGTLSTEYVTHIQGLIFRLDELNQGLMFDFRAVYETYVSDPCSNGAYLQRQVERTLAEQQRLRTFKVKVQALIALAHIKQNAGGKFLEAFVGLVNDMGGPLESQATSVEIAQSRAVARKWAEAEQ